MLNVVHSIKYFIFLIHLYRNKAHATVSSMQLLWWKMFTVTNNEMSIMSLHVNVFFMHVMTRPLYGAGVCLNCEGHTQGTNCEECKPGFYRRPESVLTEACAPCPCSNATSTGSCHSGKFALQFLPPTTVLAEC